MYGPRGGRGLALRAGRVAFADSLRNFGALAGVGDWHSECCSPDQNADRDTVMAKIFSQISDQYSTVVEREHDFVYTIHRCPVCWAGTILISSLFIAAGLLQGD